MHYPVQIQQRKSFSKLAYDKIIINKCPLQKEIYPWMLKEQSYNLHANDNLSYEFSFFKNWKGYIGKLEASLSEMLFKTEGERMSLNVEEIIRL